MNSSNDLLTLAGDPFHGCGRRSVRADTGGCHFVSERCPEDYDDDDDDDAKNKLCEKEKEDKVKNL